MLRSGNRIEVGKVIKGGGYILFIFNVKLSVVNNLSLRFIEISLNKQF